MDFNQNYITERTKKNMKKNNFNKPKFMIVTDLDGTLFNKYGKLSNKDRNTLNELADMKIIRVIATGRNLFSAKRVLPDNFPIDYLVFSSGAGIIDWNTKNLIKKFEMNKDEVKTVSKKLLKYKHDFMIHHTIPDNHYFAYYHNGKDNPDFFRRIELYKDYSYRKDHTISDFGSATQFVIIEEGKDCENKLKRITNGLNPYKVIRTTSPLDGNSLWVEIFPYSVSKAKGAEYIANIEHIEKMNIMSLGNDFNDLDLLYWAGKSYVVDNSPNELKQKFDTVNSNNNNGFSSAVDKWLHYLQIHT